MNTEQHSIKRLSRDLACRGSIVDLYRDTMQLPDGRTEQWDYVHHKKGGGACVIPVLPDGQILMIRQYRPALEEYFLELPAGVKDSSSENPASTAARELLEETGFAGDTPVFLFSMYTAIAFCNETTDFYLIEHLRQVGEPHPDAAEEITYRPYPMSELLQMIFDGRIRDAKTVAGLLAYHARLSSSVSSAALSE